MRSCLSWARFFWLNKTGTCGVPLDADDDEDVGFDWDSKSVGVVDDLTAGIDTFEKDNRHSHCLRSPHVAQVSRSCVDPVSVPIC